METIFHPANSRGFADHGWLKSHHTFSFASYHNPERMGFGALRVINDDVVAPSRGFDTHPHKNMEIISIPLSGALKHKDTMGNHFTIGKDEIQVMSAGTGIAHSEFNNSDTEDVTLLQIWVLPKVQNITPSYSQKEFDPTDRLNKFQLIVSPNGKDESLSVNQDTYFSLATLETGKELTYPLHKKDNHLYIFVISGHIKAEDIELKTRDGLGLKNLSSLNLKTENSAAEVLLMEVPD